MFTRKQLAELEALQTPKQKKVINFFVGKVMQQERNADPVEVKRMLLEKLAILTYEEEE